VGPNLLSLDRGDGVPVSDPVEDERTIDGDRARGIDDGGIDGGAKYPDELIRRSQKESVASALTRMPTRMNATHR
jgi:hypothetical protein